FVDMSSSNSWAEFAGVFCETREAYLKHDAAKLELKRLMPEDAKEAIGHGIRAKRSKSGAVSFDLMQIEVAHAALWRNHWCDCRRTGQSTDRACQPGEVAYSDHSFPVPARR